LKDDNHSLEFLWLSSNDIGDDGLSVIVDGLLCNNNIKSLEMNDCKISAKGILHTCYMCMDGGYVLQYQSNATPHLQVELIARDQIKGV